MRSSLRCFKCDTELQYSQPQALGVRALDNVLVAGAAFTCADRVPALEIAICDACLALGTEQTIVDVSDARSQHIRKVRERRAGRR